MKRTTLVLEDGILDAVRREARRRDCDMSELVNELLRQGLHRRRERPASRVELPAYDMGRPRVPLADRDALANLMEAP